MSEELQPNGWYTAMGLLAVGFFRETYRFLTKDRDANLSAMSKRISEIEGHHARCTEETSSLRYKVGGLEQKLVACEEKHADAETRIAHLEAAVKP